MTQAFYSLLIRLLVPAMVLRLLWRSRKDANYRVRLPQRLGFGLPVAPASPGLTLWVHAVSVGETIAVAPLIEAVLAQNPNVTVVVTSTTPTGASQVRRLFGERVQNLWVPFDTPGAVRRFYDHIQPSVVVLVETEIWPNIIQGAQQRQLPVMLANARLSARSARGYSRIARLSRPALRALSVIACQQRADARRFVALGAEPHKVIVAGSVKFDLDKKRLDTQRKAMMAQLNIPSSRLVILAASTHPGEERLVMRAFSQLLAHEPAALLILAPRHPERVDQIEHDVLKPAVAHFGGADYWQRRSQGQSLNPSTAVLVLDTLGELSALSGAVDIAFIGGSLVAHGGHNPLEAAAFGVPVLTGLHTTNFATIYGALARVGGARYVKDEAELGQMLTALCRDKALRSSIGTAGESYVRANQGALARQIALIDTLLAS